MRYLKSKGRECGKRKSIRSNKDSCKIACPRCGSKFHWAVDKYRMAGRRIPNKDHPESCLCHGVKSKESDKIVYHQGVRIVQGIHRKGQAGCIHSPDFGVPEYDESVNSNYEPTDDDPPF